MLKGLKRKEIIDLAIEDNIYQVETKTQAKKIANTTYKRLNSLPESLLHVVVNSDIATSKIIILISIMKTDNLFFEFMFNVFRNNIILGSYSIKDSDINNFFHDKRIQSDVVDKWSDSTIKKLKSRYLTVINFAGLLKENSKKREIIVPFIDYKIKQQLLDNDMGPYIYAVTGEK